MSDRRTPGAESPGANKQKGRRPRAGWYDGTAHLEEAEWIATIEAMEAEHGKVGR